MKLLQFFLLLFFPAFLIAQSSSSALDALISYTNARLKTNDALVNGKPFIQKNIMAAGSPFFRPEFTPFDIALSNISKLPKQDLQSNLEVSSGTLFTKVDHFTEQSLRYNLEIDAVILSKTLQNGVPFEIILNDNIVDSFSIAQHFFINKKNIPRLEEKKGYIERIFQGKFTFYRLQKIQFSNQFTEKNPNGKYTEPQASYYLVLTDNEGIVSSLKDFAAWFPEHKKEIIRFVKKRNFRFRKATLSQLTQLMNFCNEKI